MVAHGLSLGMAVRYWPYLPAWPAAISSRNFASTASPPGLACAHSFRTGSAALRHLRAVASSSCAKT
jgi:hypothetical protein